MKKLLMILPLIFLLCFTFSCQKAEEKAEEPAVDIAAEEEAIREVFAAQGKAGPAKDIELFMSYMAEDLVCAGIGDKDAVREWYSNWFSKGNYFNNGAIEKIEVSASGDMAYTVCSWELFNDEGSRGRNSNVLVWKKQADGTWKQVAY
jgi:ketosteroid isomerase-like protein